MQSIKQPLAHLGFKHEGKTLPGLSSCFSCQGMIRGFSLIDYLLCESWARNGALGSAPELKPRWLREEGPALPMKDVGPPEALITHEFMVNKMHLDLDSAKGSNNLKTEHRLIRAHCTHIFTARGERKEVACGSACVPSGTTGAQLQLD